MQRYVLYPLLHPLPISPSTHKWRECEANCTSEFENSSIVEISRCRHNDFREDKQTSGSTVGEIVVSQSHMPPPHDTRSAGAPSESVCARHPARLSRLWGRCTPRATHPIVINGPTSRRRLFACSSIPP